MADVPDDLPEGVVVIELPVVMDLDFLPYFPAHTDFLIHTEECEKCHIGAFHPEAVKDPLDPWCLTGEGLRERVTRIIEIQHASSLLN